MIRVHLTAEDIVRVRFLWDPAITVTSSFWLFVNPNHAPFAAISPLLRRTNAPGVRVLHDLVAANDNKPPAILTPGFARPVSDARHAVRERLREFPFEVPDPDVQRDLRALRAAQSPFADLTTERLRSVASEALVAYWEHVLAPFWDRATTIGRLDLARRAEQLAHAGLAALLNELSPQLAFRDSTIELEHPFQIEVPAPPAGVVFVPAVFTRRFVAHGPDEYDDPEMPLIIGYPADGISALWEKPSGIIESGLIRLLGKTRTDVLDSTQSGGTTSTISAQLKLPLATVSDHLKVLAGAHLVNATRTGRHVFYTMTPVGRELLQSAPVETR